MKTHLSLAPILLVALAGGAACAPDGPTAPQVPSQSAPIRDGGVMYGSGNGAAATQTETETAADSSGATTAERGGVMYGSGN